MQAFVPPALHLKMDCCPIGRTTEVPDVSTRVVLRTPERVKDHDFPPALAKYWAQRYRLFHRFDEGIQLDYESWYSVTPERIAKHIAKRFKHLKYIIDLYSGSGGNTIQFACNGCYVTGVEIDQQRIEMAKNNARVYGVEQGVDFICGDVDHALSCLTVQSKMVDGIFLSPPWGGPEYLNVDIYDVSVFQEVVARARSITPNVAVLVPRNVELQNVFDTFGTCELEKNFLCGKVKTHTIYFGNLVRQDHNVEIRKMVSSWLYITQPNDLILARVKQKCKRRRRNKKGEQSLLKVCLESKCIKK